MSNQTQYSHRKYGHLHAVHSENVESELTYSLKIRNQTWHFFGKCMVWTLCIHLITYAEFPSQLSFSEIMNFFGLPE